MNRAIVLPKSWAEQAELFMARLKRSQPCFFTILIPDSVYEGLGSFSIKLYSFLDQYEVDSSLIVLPNSWAKTERMHNWPRPVHIGETRKMINSIFFADHWHKVESMLQEFLDEENDLLPKTNLTCQYQPPYTTTLQLWASAGAEEFHPGDYFKSEILTAISQMTGNWVYWGHGEGELLRGYGHLEKQELLIHIPKKPLNATLWFTCSTLDKNIPDNIALSWYLSGATKCLFASPYKVKTEANKLLSEAWLKAAQSQPVGNISSVILQLLATGSHEIEEVLDNYYLLGNPWVRAGV